MMNHTMTFADVMTALSAWVAVRNESASAEERKEADWHILRLDSIRQDMVAERVRAEAPNQMTLNFEGGDDQC